MMTSEVEAKFLGRYLEQVNELSSNWKPDQTSQQSVTEVARLHAREPLFIVSQLKEGIASSLVLYTQLDSKQYLVLSRTDHLAFFQIQSIENSDATPEFATLHLNEKFRIDGNTISCMAPFNIDGIDSIITYDNFNCISIVQHLNRKSVVSEIIKLNPKGHQQANDSKPILVTGSENNTDQFMVLYCFQGYIHLLYPPKNNTQSMGKRKRATTNSGNWTMSTVSIGTSVIQKMVTMKNSRFIAILYRDFNFNYSLRYYEVDVTNRNASLYKQFEEFESPPSCLIPLSIGGVMALTGAHIFYFGSPRVSIALDNLADSSVSINTDENVITKDLLAQHSYLISEIFVSHTVIDDQRVLLVSNSGMTYMVHIQSQFESSKFLVFNGIDIIKLGKSTIPVDGGLHHINDNYFFQASNSSRSVVFQVLPDSPHVNICSYLESSPPVLDIDIHPTGDLLVCQGSYEAGEFSRFTPQHYSLKPVTSFQLKIPSVKLNMIKNTTKFIVENAINELKVYEFKHGQIRQSNALPIELEDENPHILQVYHISPSKSVTLSSSGVTMKKNFTAVSILMGEIIKPGLVAYVTIDLRLVIQNEGKTASHNLETLPRFFQVVDMKSSVLISIMLQDSDKMLIFEYYFSSNNLEQIQGLEIVSPYSKPIILSLPHGEIFIIGIDEEENGVDQIRISNDKGRFKVIDKTKVNLPNCLGITFNIDSNIILLWDSYRVFSMKYSQILKHYVPSRILEAEFKFEISDIKVLDESNILILQHTTNKLEVFNLISMDRNRHANTFQNDLMAVQTFRSNYIILKSIQVPSTPYSLIITQETHVADRSGNIKKVSNLELIDNNKLQLVDKFTDPAIAEYIDMCSLEYVDEEGLCHHLIFALLNCTGVRGQYNVNDKPIHILEIEQDRIKKLYNSPSLFDIFQKKLKHSNSQTYFTESNFQSSTNQLDKVSLQSIRVLSYDKYDNEIKLSIGGSINFILSCTIEHDCVPSDPIEFSFEVDTQSVNQVPVFPITQCISFKDPTIYHADIRDGIYRVDSRNKRLKLLNVKYTHNFITSMECTPRFDQSTNTLKLQLPDTLVSGDSFGNVSIYENQNQCAAFNIGDQINSIKVMPEEKNQMWISPVAIVGTLNGGIYRISRVHESISEALLKCLGELASALPSRSDSLDWKGQIDANTGTVDRKDHFGIVDQKIIDQFLVDEGRIVSRPGVSKQALEERLTSYSSCLQHLQLLQKVTLENSSVWTILHY